MDTHMTAPALSASSPGMDLRAYCDHASKLRESSDIAKIAHALVQAQKALANPPRNRTVKVRTKTGGEYVFRYATLDQIMDAARPALGEAGLCVLQPIVSTEKGSVLVTRLLHESGQWMECEIPLPRLGEDLQGFGSAVSYVRRYAVSAMLNITADEDDDGNTAAGNHVADAPRRDHGRAGTTARVGRQEPAPRRREADAMGPDGAAAAPSASPDQPDAAPARAASAPRQASDRTPRRKDEAAPPSAWRIVRPGKADLTAPDGAAWLKWWTDLAAKAEAEGKREGLRTLRDANAAAWDEIALVSPETEAVMAQASQAVRAVLDS